MKDKEVIIVSSKTDITSAFLEEHDLITKIVPQGCPSEKTVIELRYLPLSNPISYTALCSSFDKSSGVCEHCTLNPNPHPTRLDFKL